MPSRVYFYKDDKGKVKKFAYCSMCGEGPFKQSELNFKFISLHNKDGYNYCLRCARALNMSLDDVTDRSSSVEKEQVHIISFEKEKPPEKSHETLLRDRAAKDVVIPPKPHIEPGPYYVYIGQFNDNTYISGVTKDIIKDIDRLNSGENEKLKKLPIEIVYYHIEETMQEAITAKNCILGMNYKQKEILIEKFINNFFDNE